MNSKQEQILKNIAYKHGISIGHAKDIWRLYTNKVAETISETDKKENGEFQIEKFKTISVQYLGKFIPHKRKINYANLYLKKK